MTDKQLTEVELSDELQSAINTVADLIYYHISDTNQNQKLKAALRILVKAVINQNKQS